MAKGKERFVVQYKQGGAFSGITKVLVDTQTGVNYLWYNEGYAGGLTPLLDREGKPIVTSVAYLRRTE